MDSENANSAHANGNDEKCVDDGATGNIIQGVYC